MKKKANSSMLLKRIITQMHEVQKITDNATAAQEGFKAAVEYFGETIKTMPPETFFPLFDKFIKNYKGAAEDVDKWRTANEKKAVKEQKRIAAEQSKLREAQAKQQKEAIDMEQAAIKELRALKKRDRTTILNQDGAMEDNAAFLKKQPYRRADAVQRSFRGIRGRELVIRARCRTPLRGHIRTFLQKNSIRYTYSAARLSYTCI